MGLMTTCLATSWRGPPRLDDYEDILVASLSPAPFILGLCLRLIQ